MNKCHYPGRRIVPRSAWLVSQLILLVGSASLATASSSQDKTYPLPDFGLEITIPGSLYPPIKFTVVKGGRSLMPIQRQLLTITDPKLAADFTMVGVSAFGEDNGVRVRLSIIYNDLSKQDWWNDNREKVAGTLLIREGQSARPAELARFGIEPFEIRVVNARPVVIQPGEWPKITNSTKSLEVAKVEKSLDSYYFLIKNKSSKNVVAYTLSTTNGTFSSSGPGLIAAGAMSTYGPINSEYIDRGGMAIPVVIFDDGSFEGDIKVAARFLVNAEGVRKQAPHILRLVEQTLQVNDAELEKAFEKLEAELQAIPEAMDKQSAVALLKSTYPSFDDVTISTLYEHLKGGFYEAKNKALAPIDEIKRQFPRAAQHQEPRPSKYRAVVLRETLTQIKQEFERIIASKK
ncbi:MAG TPA: hypothetical protein VKA70_19565 [Blastocatellia bacterium]|nr:hypothetical protein [Blastocatellia bacterium]